LLEVAGSAWQPAQWIYWTMREAVSRLAWFMQLTFNASP
jgi:hypothetical protein